MPCAPSLSTSPGLAAMLWSDGFFSGAVGFVRRTLVRSAFLGCQIGVPRCSVLFAQPGRRASRHRRYHLNQRSPYFRWSSSVPVCTLFSRLPQASLLRSDSFFSGAVCFVRRTFARSVFHGFSIGFQRCKSVLNRVDLVKSVHVAFSQSSFRNR